jgi:NAD(P)-dependent dehydrogenase (short-subunit alcohol dehydrogenase family)
MPSLTGTTAVVTGANSGIGWHTALELARHGASVTLGVRTRDKGEDAAARIRDRAAGADVHVAVLDLASLASVQDFAAAWQGPLGLLVNNAGVMTPPRYRRTGDGFELQLGTNHLGHFALTARLLPALLGAAQPRVVTVSSLAHRSARAETLLAGNPEQGYNASRYYGDSKLANLLFTFELQRRATAAGTDLAATAAHPGVSHTNLVTSEQGMGSLGPVRVVAPLVLRLLTQPAAAGAEPTLYAATAADPGSYTGPQRLRESRGYVGPATVSTLATEEHLAAQVWAMSEDLTGVRFDWSVHRDSPAPQS